MSLTYVALIHKVNLPRADYGVIFPDFPGAVFGGKNLQSAVENAREGLLFHMEGLLNAGEALPKPQSLDQIVSTLNAKEIKEISSCLIHIIPPTGDLVRINISLEAGLLGEIDRAAKTVGKNRSAFLAQAARYWLA